MVPAERSSAVVIRVVVPDGIERLRRRWDPSAAVGVPAHITILYPFVPVADLTPGTRHELVDLARNVPQFEITFRRVDRFPEVVYLAPEPVAPITSLMDRVVARYPAYPPYGGTIEVVIPHLTVTEAAPDQAPLDEIAVEAQRALPFRHRATAIELLVEAENGRWHRRWSMPLG